MARTGYGHMARHMESIAHQIRDSDVHGFSHLRWNPHPRVFPYLDVSLCRNYIPRIQDVGEMLETGPPGTRQVANVAEGAKLLRMFLAIMTYMCTFMTLPANPRQ